MSYSAAPPFALSNGARNASVALVGEALGETEQALGAPFLGQAGQELARMCFEAELTSSGPFRTLANGDKVQLSAGQLKDWWAESGLFLTNVIAMRPTETSNDFNVLCGSKAEVGGKSYEFPAIKQGKYLRPEYLAELTRLQQELMQVKPHVVIALGGVASWALLRSSAITAIRGTVTPSVLVPGQKVLPTFHPSYVNRVWKDRPIVLCDLAKAKRESAFAEFRRPERQILVSPTLAEVYAWVHETLKLNPALLACDIETIGNQIESIGFARSARCALVVPFIDTKNYVSYWPTCADEIEARKLCDLLLSSSIPKLGQNFLYDMQYLLREGFTLRNIAEDTMLLHHSIFPELSKGLAFLGSVYSNEPAWKLMRKRAKEEELKRDD